MIQIWQSPHWPRFDYDRRATEAALALAQESLGEIRGVQAGLSAEDIEHLQYARIVEEAVASFGIEGVRLDPGQIEASVIASLRHRTQGQPARRADAIAALMLAARSTKGALSEAELLSWHQLLFFGIEIEDPGRWRSFDIEIVRSASPGRADVLYLAPPPERVAAEMTRFLDWFNAPQDLPAPVFAALAHLWFESVHPFSDGNGRIGRALIDVVFARSRGLPFALSRQIEREKKEYYAALQAGRREGQGALDATEFVLWFLGCLTRAAQSSREEVRFLLRRNAFFTRYRDLLSARQAAALQLIFAQGATRVAEGVSARSWRKLTGAASATATRDLAALEAAGVLTRNTAGGRSVSYQILW